MLRVYILPFGRLCYNNPLISNTDTDENNSEIVENVLKYNLSLSDYNEHFKIIKLIDDQLEYLKYEVKCYHCIRSKSLTTDARSPSNLKKHI